MPGTTHSQSARVPASRPDDDRRLVDVAAAAAMLSISTRSVWLLASLGDLPRVTLGPRMTRFAVEDIEALIQRRRRRG